MVDKKYGGYMSFPYAYIILSDDATQYSKCTIPYTIDLFRKSKPCDQNMAAGLKLSGWWPTDYLW